MAEQAQTTNSAEATATATPAAAAPQQAPASMVTEVTAEAKPPVTETKADAPVEYKLKVPEGSKLGAEYVEKFVSLAKETGLPPDKAQVFLDREIQAQADFAEAQKAELKTLNEKTWLEELKADKEIGGEKFAASGQAAFKAGAFLFGEDGVQALVKAGLNHNPLLFRGLVKLGNLMNNDSFVLPGAQSAPAQKSVADLFYGKPNKE